MDADGRAGDRRRGAASAYVEARQAAGRAAFPLVDLMRSTGLSHMAARRQLGRLGAGIVRVSRLQPFFLVVPPEHRARGAPPAEWWLDDYFRWLGEPYYLGLMSAAGAHGSSPQGLQVTQVMVGTPRRPLKVRDRRIHFFVKTGIERTPTQELGNAYAPLKVSTPAATVFDLIRYADRIGGMGRAVETLRPLLARVSVTELRSVLEAEKETATAQRLGYVLDRLGNPKLADAVDAWLPRRRPIGLAGSAADGKRTPRSGRWQVRDDTGEFDT